ncbi:MAG: hypothetical protein WBB29_01935 [Geitlerinemataceae cyanobacterium]
MSRTFWTYTSSAGLTRLPVTYSDLCRVHLYHCDRVFASGASCIFPNQLHYIIDFWGIGIDRHLLVLVPVPFGFPGRFFTCAQRYE